MIDDPGGLLHWANAQGLAGKTLQQAREKVMDPGTLAHETIEAQMHGEPMPEIPEEHQGSVANCVIAYTEWMELNRLEPLESEGPRVSAKYLFGGTPDLIAQDHKGRIWLPDFKTGTGSAVYPAMLLQIRSYGALVEECDGLMVDRYALFKLDRESANFHVHVYTAESLEPAWEAFKLCRQLYELRRVLKKVA
jgi:hypothetical protein